MNAREFFDLVCNMRDAQREYFKVRTRQALMKSLDLEKAVDSEIIRVKEIIKNK